MSEPDSSKDKKVEIAKGTETYKKFQDAGFNDDEIKTVEKWINAYEYSESASELLADIKPINPPAYREKITKTEFNLQLLTTKDNINRLSDAAKAGYENDLKMINFARPVIAHLVGKENFEKIKPSLNTLVLESEENHSIEHHKFLIQDLGIQDTGKTKTHKIKVLGPFEAPFYKLKSDDGITLDYPEGSNPSKDFNNKNLMYILLQIEKWHKISHERNNTQSKLEDKSQIDPKQFAARVQEIEKLNNNGTNPSTTGDPGSMAQLPSVPKTRKPPQVS